MKTKVDVDQRVLVAAIRYAMGRQTGMIDICREELEYNIGNLSTWLVEAILSDSKFYLGIEAAAGQADHQIINIGYVNSIIYMCEKELEARKANGK